MPGPNRAWWSRPGAPGPAALSTATRRRPFGAALHLRQPAPGHAAQARPLPRRTPGHRDAGMAVAAGAGRGGRRRRPRGVRAAGGAEPRRAARDRDPPAVDRQADRGQVPGPVRQQPGPDPSGDRRDATGPSAPGASISGGSPCGSARTSCPCWSTCSPACPRALPPPADGYVPAAHTGGPGVRQPFPGRG